LTGILIDRVSHGGSSATAELLLQLAMINTGNRPVVLVIDNAARLEKYRSDIALNQLTALREVCSRSVPFGQQDEDDQGVQPFSFLVDPQDFEGAEDMGYAVTTESAGEWCAHGIIHTEADLPCSRPDPAHVTDARRQCQRLRGGGQAEVDEPLP
jgi:hypothetical protein